MGNNNSFIGHRTIRVYVNRSILVFDCEYWRHVEHTRCLAKGPFGIDTLFTSFDCKTVNGRIDTGHIVDVLTHQCLKKLASDNRYFDKLKERANDA